MGFKLSRLAQAMMAALFCSTASFAAEKADDFYIEIKGPESSVQHVQQPVQPATPSTIKSNLIQERAPHPYVPESRDKSLLSTKSTTYGPVKKTDTTWSIANNIKKLYPGQGITTRKVMQALYRKNPQSFVSGQLDTLLAGSRLAIPSLDEIKAANIRPLIKTPTNVAQAKKQVAQPITKPQSVESTATNTVSAATSTIASVPVTATASSSVVASTEPSLVDSKVSELVGKPEVQSTASAATTATEPKVDNEALLVYQAENKELKDRVQQLNEQVGHLQADMQNQEQLKQELAALQNQLKEHEQEKAKEPEKKTEPVVNEAAKTTDGGFWSDILATPLNLLLLISLPVLAVLVVLSFWLRSRAKRQMAAREQEMAETTTLMMDEANSDFGELLAVDLSDDNLSFPDLNLQDESLIPTSLLHDTDKKSTEAELQDIPLPPDVVPTITEELPPLATQPQIDLNEDDESEVMSRSVEAQDFATILSDADLANALEDDFSFSATEDDEKQIADTQPIHVDLSTEPEEDVADLAARLNLDKVMADPGVQMSDQVVSEPSGWELSEEDDSTAFVATSQAGVNLREVNDDSNKPWLQQFETEQLGSEKATDVPEDYLSIDELLAQADKQASNNPDEMQANLDIGLDEYPDMLPEQGGIDIDDDGGVGAKLDLARAYLEIDDKASAKELLLEVQSQGSNEQIKEAEKLLSRIT
ncbi:FimV/HubP family polar landmark protein [uncultured Tolumonas sp.]|uniref:FimV/HubP family polar landmark protein n=1 Tax=uncultured Tolumonas sp. TaxID=263765 RepID=UPI00292E95D5|nr:FimV/HubP family polar landmark protein [uncultured Tolumonas sp.]